MVQCMLSFLMKRSLIASVYVGLGPSFIYSFGTWSLVYGPYGQIRAVRTILLLKVAFSYFHRQKICFWVFLHCTIGRGGVKTKWRQDACYWLWKLCVKILAAMKKDPSQFRKCPEQCFLRPDLNFFLEFQKKILFTIFVTLKMTIKKYFFQKKTCQKNLPTKFVEKICQLKMASGCMLLTMKSRCRNTFFNEKRPELVQEMSGTMIF